jgi:SAM-dependent methyltransferase
MIAATMTSEPVLVLRQEERRKLDSSDDTLFYAEPRFVQHLDAAFRARLTQLYRQRIPACAVVLDLMSSWVSHLPEEVRYQKVIGHGLNAEELAANPRFDRHWVQDLNRDQRLPLEDASVDAVLIVAGWQYLQQPEAVAAELLRVVRPRGQVIVAFSNRMFFQKAPQVWTDGGDRDHLAYVGRVLLAQGWGRPELIAESTSAAGPLGWIGAKGDPFFAVVAERPPAAAVPEGIGA